MIAERLRPLPRVPLDLFPTGLGEPHGVLFELSHTYGLPIRIIRFVLWDCNRAPRQRLPPVSGCTQSGHPYCGADGADFADGADRKPVWSPELITVIRMV